MFGLETDNNIFLEIENGTLNAAVFDEFPIFKTEIETDSLEMRHSSLATLNKYDLDIILYVLNFRD